MSDYKPVTQKPILGPTGEHRAFFGRKSGKTLHKGQRHLFDNLLPKLAITLPASGAVQIDEILENPSNHLVMEIGYGGGENLCRLAATHQDTNYIGCEVFNGGIGKILQKIDEDGLSNIRLFTDDAYKLLVALPDGALDEIYLLYPDPWPKSRHHKRRFVSSPTLDQLARVLKPNGLFHFATDISDYANWTLAHILRHPQFFWPLCAPGAWHLPYDGWQPTRYERKARKEGRLKSYYFTFKRR